MRPDGFIFLVLSWALIAGMTLYCFVKVFGKKSV